MMILAMHEYPDWVEAEEGGQMYEEEGLEYEEEEEEEEDEEDYPEGEEESVTDEEDSEGLGEEESDKEDPEGLEEEESDQEVPDVGEEEYDEEDPEEHLEIEEEVWEYESEEDGEVYEDYEENWEEENEQEEGRANEEEGGIPPEDDHNGDSDSEVEEASEEEEKDEDEGELEEEHEEEERKKEYYDQDLEEEKEDEADESTATSERYCAYCDLSFASDGALIDHLRNSSRHNWCPECDHDFDTAGRLRNHEVRHLPKVHPCLRHGCAAKFAAISALAKHMEKSRCFGKPSAATLVEKVRDWETKSGNPNLLTKPGIGWHDSYITRSSTCYANEGAWNGRAYDCYYCDKECNTLYGLNQHVNSGIHDSEPKDFCCKQCGFTATWMSALIEHIESEKCGYMSRDEVHSFARKPLKFALLTLGCP